MTSVDVFTPRAQQRGWSAAIHKLATSSRIVRRIAAVSGRHYLLAELVSKDFDTRYAGSVLGVAWTQLYPLLLLLVYSFVFSVIFPNTIPNFPVFLFVGIVLWSFFSNAIQLATGSVITNAQLVKKVGFPRELVTISVIIISLVDLAASHLILIAGALAFGIHLAWSWISLPGLVLLFAGLCTGIGLILATAAVYLRDVRFFVEVVVLLLMFVSPVFYSEANVPASVTWVMAINPVAVMISAYRHAFLDGLWPSLAAWLTLAGSAAVSLLVGIEVFDRGQRGFPDAL
ncbi:MAG: ABC transporter permease [Chloroflexota bacterium]